MINKIPNELVSIILNKIQPEIILNICEFNEEILDMIIYSKIGLDLSKMIISDYDLMLLSGIEAINCSGKMIENKQYKITDQGILALFGIKRIDMSNCPNITDECFSVLSEAEHVKMANCHKITDIGVSKLKHVKTLDISFCDKITDNGIISLKNLDLLLFTSKYITEKSLGVLCPRTEWNPQGCLTGGIQYMSMTDKHAELDDNIYKAISGVKCVNFNMCNIIDDFVGYLTNVKLVIFSCCSITIACLEKLRHVQEIILAEYGNGIDNFIEKMFKNVKQIDFSGAKYN